MRTVFLSLAAAAAAIATASPVMADEARVEARAGVIWSGGSTEAIAGIAAGYDFDLGHGTFIGAEISGDKVLEGGTRTSLGIGGRIGIQPVDDGKLYVVSAYQTKLCRFFCKDSVSLGAGYQHNLGGNLYGKVEYRHYFMRSGVRDANAVTGGVGFRF